MSYAGYNDYEHRTAGYAAKPKTVQAWKTKSAPKAQADIIANLEKAKKGQIGRFDGEVRTAAMAYAPQQRVAQSSEAFQFGDVIDIVNPLQHLPLVSMVYRGLTNDRIGPAAQIVGGAIYGGPIGAVAGTVNAVSQIQTGRDMGEHMLGFAGLKVGTAESKMAATSYARASLDNMPPPERITSFKLNS